MPYSLSFPRVSNSIVLTIPKIHFTVFDLRVHGRGVRESGSWELGVFRVDCGSRRSQLHHSFTPSFFSRYTRSIAKAIASITLFSIIVTTDMGKLKAVPRQAH